jgi:Spy/CpxP family protein refolding chaperone
MLLVLFAMIALCSAWAAAQDKTKDQPGKARGQLPQNWSKLGLNDEQKQKVYRVQNDYRPKIDELQKQITDLRDKERREMEAVLTDAQKARLREILTSKAPPDDKGKGKDK